MDVHQVIEHTVEVLLVKALVSYDSVYGNTEKIANAASTAITPYGGIRALRAGDADLSESESGDLRIMGSPTHGGRTHFDETSDFLNEHPQYYARLVYVL